MRELFEYLSIVLSIFIIAGLISGTAFGIRHGTSYANGCSSIVRKYEVLIPTYRLGCWLATPLYEKDKK